MNRELLYALKHWWSEKRPEDFSVKQHLLNPDIGLQSPGERRLAKELAKHLRLAQRPALIKNSKPKRWDELKGSDPICQECAEAAGLRARSSMKDYWEQMCAVCHLPKVITARREYLRPRPAIRMKKWVSEPYRDPSETAPASSGRHVNFVSQRQFFPSISS